MESLWEKSDSIWRDSKAYASHRRFLDCSAFMHLLSVLHLLLLVVVKRMLWHSFVFRFRVPSPSQASSSFALFKHELVYCCQPSLINSHFCYSFCLRAEVLWRIDAWQEIDKKKERVCADDDEVLESRSLSAFSWCSSFSILWSRVVTILLYHHYMRVLCTPLSLNHDSSLLSLKLWYTQEKKDVLQVAPLVFLGVMIVVMTKTRREVTRGIRASLLH